MSDRRHPSGSALELSMADLAGMQELSSQLKEMREPVRELTRVATGGACLQAPTSAALLGRLHEQLEATQHMLLEYLNSVAGLAPDHPALTRHQRRTLSRRESAGRRDPRPRSKRESLMARPQSRAESLRPQSRGELLLARPQSKRESTRSRSSTQGSQDSSIQTPRPASLFVPTEPAVPVYLLAALPETPNAAQDASISNNTYAGAGSPNDVYGGDDSPNGVYTGAGNPNGVHTYIGSPNGVHTHIGSPKGVHACIVSPNNACVSSPTSAYLGPTSRNAYAVERAIVTMWRRDADAQTAQAVNEAGVALGRRHTTLEERVPTVPVRILRCDTAVDVIDLISRMLNTRTADTPSILTHRLETIPPGIVAGAIANSTGQLFARVTPDVVAAYADGRDAPALRMLSDHANFLTRVMETTIAHPQSATQRARRIEWWAVAVCIARELGDYEAVSSLACVFGGAAVARLGDAWALVSAPCKAAVRFLQDRVLKIVPNYASYRAELRLRLRRMRPRAAREPMPTGGADDELDFDSAVAISTPDLCAVDDSYVSSAVFSKDAADLPPPRMLVPIVAVLLKDAVSEAADGASRKPRLVRTPEPALHWAAVIDACRSSAPLSLDYFMLRRVFATEPSTLALASPPPQSLARGAMSTASSFLRRMPRRHSTDNEGPKELSLTPCRLLLDKAAPTIVDVLGHLLLIAAGTPCYACFLGNLLEPLHVATSAQLAVAITARLLFAEPWMPREFLARLCDLREPRPVKSPPLSGPANPALSGTASLAQHNTASPASMATGSPAPMISGTHSLGSESRTAERPWLMSFKLADSADSARYFRARGTLPPPRDMVEPVRKTSTDSESTCVNRPPSPPARIHRRSLSATIGPVSVAPFAAEMPPLPSTEIQLANADAPSYSLPPPLPGTEMPVYTPPPPLPRAGIPTWLPLSDEPANKPPPASSFMEPMPIPSPTEHVPIPSPTQFVPIPSPTQFVPISSPTELVPISSPTEPAKRPMIRSPPPPQMGHSLPKDDILAPPLPSLPMPRFQPPSTQPVSQSPPNRSSVLAAPPNRSSVLAMPPNMPHMFNVLPLSHAKMKQLDGISAETQMLLSFDSRSRKR